MLIQDLPPVASVAEIPDGFEPSPLGSRQAVIASVRATLPEIDFSDPSWRAIDPQTGDFYSPAGAEAGFDAWAQWRDRAIGEMDSA